MAKITMPFFQATSTEASAHEGSRQRQQDEPAVGGSVLHDAQRPGPAHAAAAEPALQEGPGRTRPQNLAGRRRPWNLNEQTAFNQTHREPARRGPVLPAAEVQGVANKYGVNKAPLLDAARQLHRLPADKRLALALQGQPELRQAINYVINRKDYVSQAGPYAGQPWTHIFNPGVPGWKNVTLYKKNLTKPRSWPRATSRRGKINVGFRSSSTIEHRPGPDRQA